MSGYMNRTLQDALDRAEYDKDTLPLIVQVEPSDYDRIILAEEIRRLRGIVSSYRLQADQQHYRDKVRMMTRKK